MGLLCIPDQIWFYPVNLPSISLPAKESRRIDENFSSPTLASGISILMSMLQLELLKSQPRSMVGGEQEHWIPSSGTSRQG